MNISDLFNKGEDASGRLMQSVKVFFMYGQEDLDPLHQLENKLRIALFHSGLGEYHRYEIAMDYADGFLYFYGPNAEALFKSIRQILLETSFMKNAEVYLRFGGVGDGGASEIEFTLE